MVANGSSKQLTWRRFLLRIGLLVVFSSAVRAQQLPLKTYTTTDGLAQNMVLRMVRDSRGYMWFCTAEGLSRFDGYRFTNYTTDQGLPHRSVRDLLETRNGAHWVATGDGLCRFNPQSKGPMFVVYRPDASLTSRSIRELYEDRAGTVWCGTQGGLYRLEEVDGQVRFHFIDLGMPTESEDDTFVVSLLEDRRGVLWVGTRGSGLYRRSPDGRVQRFTMRHGLPINRLNALLEDQEGRIWAGTTRGLCLLVSEPDLDHPVVARVYGKKNFGLPSDWVEALFQPADGRLWVALAGGLSEFTPAASGDRQEFHSYTSTHGLNYLDLTSLAEDRAGNLWIGATGGAMKLARNGFTTFTEVGDHRPFGVSGIFETRSGELCLIAREMSARPFVIRHDAKGLSLVRPRFPNQITYYGWGWNQIGFQDREGEWWIPTGQGLCRFPKVSRVEQLARTKPKTIYTTKDGLSADEVWRIFEDSRGDIWIATTASRSGVSRWERATGTFYHYSEADGLPAGAWAGAFCEDAAGNVWFGIGGSLVRNAAGRVRVFTGADGLPGEVHGLHVDLAGRLWVATDTGGLSRLDEPAADRPSFINYQTVNGLVSNQVWCVTSDRQGRIYAFTGRGLDRLDPATGQVKHYTQADGLIGGAPKVAYRDRHGTLWFGTDLGISRLVPEQDAPQPPPVILISGLHVTGDRQPLSELGESAVPELRLGPNESQIQIDFVGPNFDTGEQLRYQYRLEGADSGWSPPSEQRSITYARLSPGRYRFLARAVTSDGRASDPPASVTFTMLPPVWQRWWFVTIAAALAGLLIYAAYRYRLARAVELERVRTRIAADLHDDIGASLSRMAILSEVVKQQVGASARESVPLLADIGDSARQLIGSMRDIVWAIDPRRDDLGSAASRIREFAADVFEGKQISWEFSAPEGAEKFRLGPDQRRHLILFFKEAITNAARHSGCREARFSIEVARNRLVAQMSDDGQGFNVAYALQVSGNGRGGYGLENMRRRVALLGGSLEIDSQPGRGTRLKLTIPLRKP